ncbi:MAPEG family protein [Bradyrhizobium sp. LHD-71]|uniref:MAPEG family protein n=1 Tax=Bradyrhizobium sp. LHD-71 TaxID=3072141 RepID=UPI00280F96E5|nr:MAPEG family protein [Bradyrhizobium sp. LHD-71]MDQ8729610.1 MAPEG family protein [Bradyrhizobium sp. LHD-71]
MPFAYWCVLIAALMPLALVSYAKFGSYDNHHPRDNISELPDMKRRAYAAHQNAYENFPFFAVAVITATLFGASISTVNILAALYIVLRGIHAVLYIADAATARSAVYTAGLLVTIAIFVLPAFE